MDELIQHLVNALILGGTYALLGIGLTLIFGIMNVVNFTHGALYTVGAYVMYLAAAALGLNFFLALPVAILGGLLLGAAIELVLLRPFRGSDIDTTMLVMIGAGIVLQSGTLWIFGGVAKAIPSPFPEAPLQIGPVSVSWLRLFVLGAALGLIALTYTLINRTKLGLAMRAAFQDADTAALMGVDVHRIYTATFALGSSLAAAAGALLGPVYVVFPQMGGLAELKAFAIVILGGLGNVTGAAIGGFILALAEELGAGYVSSGYRDAMGFLIIIAVLLYKPTGLFAKAERIG
ncbi:branched-chain amino acid ABC transporter permease [Methylobacterium sp. NEAU K]|uniref:branched-chain amino acid ABC transporter permease n=1 Tax=Methylobacterium sp. NEAU K TaxID=3064946 RepID=UPI002736D3CF|nr:branched-chain amino acid ABC transporter permease [Methylobacterium sp. NEAU K]MDP4005975.1 branched-chain amino acid ABC transporter permease [Methylobacterium sp. NEAU K]